MIQHLGRCETFSKCKRHEQQASAFFTLSEIRAIQHGKAFDIPLIKLSKFKRNENNDTILIDIIRSHYSSIINIEIIRRYNH